MGAWRPHPTEVVIAARSLQNRQESITRDLRREKKTFLAENGLSLKEFARITRTPRAGDPGHTDKRRTLTDDLVRKARELRADGVPNVLIAERLGVKEPAASKAIHGVNWRHVK